jgi:hypothetical protein
MMKSLAIVVILVLLSLTVIFFGISVMITNYFFPDLGNWWFLAGPLLFVLSFGLTSLSVQLLSRTYAKYQEKKISKKYANRDY